jgi:dTDP-4-dehydrorhamnose reductase
MMKIIVTGAGGLLGQEVWRAFEKNHTLVAIGRNQPNFIPSAQWRQGDLTQESLVHDLITRENPDLVVHTAAVSNVDGAEKSPDDTYRQNALACRNLALGCQRFDAVLMSVSTDYVFDGASPPVGGYREFDVCHPLSKYGESKYWGEQFVSQLLNKFFIVRTSWLFGPGRKTWVDQVATAVQDGNVVNAVSDMSSAPTYTPDLAAAMLTLAESRHYGYYHLSNTGFCTRPELANEVARLTGNGKPVRLKLMTQDELALAARRPRHSGLDNLTWRLNGYEPLRSWQTALAAHFEKQAK